MLLSGLFDDDDTPQPLTRRELRATSVPPMPAPPVARAVRPHVPPPIPWRRRRPLIGGILLALGGGEMFISARIDLGHLRVQLGVEGVQSLIIPLALVLLGALSIAWPARHVLFGVLALAVALYSLIGLNLGGFIVGMVLATAGGVLIVAWMRPERSEPGTGSVHQGNRMIGREPR